jgi:ectoine hydroxylase-related dioxygenase (phytanoyl-CoA dioxygenase family)
VKKYNNLRKNSSIPWFEKDIADKILKKKSNNLTEQEKKDARFFITNGYVILKNIISEKFCDSLRDDFFKITKSNDFKKNPKYFHYNKSPRIIEGWKKSNFIKKICFEKKIISFLKLMYGNEPVPISTINFLKGTEQPLHSDYIHFGSLPELYLAGVWFALEKIDFTNGPLQICPKSHKLDIVDFTDLKLKIPKTTSELKSNYTKYEKYLLKIISKKKLRRKKIKLNKGDVLIWAANLLHGGIKIKNEKKTRLSQVVHYHFKGLKKIYNPCFSSRLNGMYAERNINSIKIK